eukprot:scaffold19698_cov125-Isochrysis_galbana.AAC.3
MIHIHDTSYVRAVAVATLPCLATSRNSPHNYSPTQHNLSITLKRGLKEGRRGPRRVELGSANIRKLAPGFRAPTRQALCSRFIFIHGPAPTPQVPRPTTGSQKDHARRTSAHTSPPSRRRRPPRQPRTHTLLLACPWRSQTAPALPAAATATADR